MFTGIVAANVKVENFSRSISSMELSLKVPSSLTKNLDIGASISINGVCLTVIKQQPLDPNYHLISFDIIEETLEKTGLSNLIKGSMVNFERSLTFGGEVGGHILTGHISTEAKISKIETKEQDCIFHFLLEKKWQDYLIPKTHIAIDGISLTLAKISQNDKPEFICFTCHLIPETLRVTTLGFKKEGDFVNIEFNQTIKVIVETTKRILDGQREGIY